MTLQFNSPSLERCSNTIELHYWLNNDSHSMDANIENRCDYAILGILKELGIIFETELIIETEALGEGGLRRWLKIIFQTEQRKATISTALLIAILTVTITTPLSQVGNKLIDKIFEDKELKQLEKDKLKLEIQNLKIDINQKGDTIHLNNLIKRKKSNFYQALDNCKKVNSISFISTDSHKEYVYNEKTIEKKDFSKYILITDDLEPIEDENSVIEIISPVLKKGNYRWMGIYNGEPIIFNMQSKEFKSLVQNGEIEFKNGSSINCHIRIRKKIDNEGLEKTVGYDVLRVNHYFENNKPIETKEGRKHRQKKEAERQQPSLFDNPNNIIEE